MSRATRILIAPTPRKSVSKARRARIFLSANGMCHLCGNQIRDREEFTRKVKVAAWERAGGRCEQETEAGYGDTFRINRCNKKLFPGDINYDHVIPWAISFDSSLSNCQCLCKAHHLLKTTSADIPTIAKGKRIAANHIGATKTKRGFHKPPGTSFNWNRGRYERPT